MEQEEEPDCEPPAPKKKKKKDKLAVDQENGHIIEATDLNGNSNVVDILQQKIKKNKDTDPEVSTGIVLVLNGQLYLLCI